MGIPRISSRADIAPRVFGGSNAYAGEIPAYSLVVVSAIATDIWTIDRPAADNIGNVMATGAAKAPQNGACAVSADWPLPVKYAGAAPSVGDERGVASGSFELTAGKTGFKVWAVDVDNGLAWAAPSSGGGGASAVWAVGDEKRAYRTDDHVIGRYTWKILDGRTIGDASSGADWANADAEALFLFLYAHVSDTYCPVSGGRGASAAADWAAHKTLTIPDSRGDSYGPRYSAGAHATPAGSGEPPAVGETGGDASLTPGLTVADDIFAAETDTAAAYITYCDEWQLPWATEECRSGYVRMFDAGHKHRLIGVAWALLYSTTKEFDVRPRYLAAGTFILAKIT